MRGIMLGAALAAAALLALAGCGSPAKPAAATSTTPAAVTPSAALTPSAAVTPAVQTLLAQTLSAIDSARSVHLSGQAASGTSQYFVTISMTHSGDISGTFAQGSQANQLTVLATGGKVYLKITAGFLKAEKAPAAVCSLICGKWLLATAADAKSITGGMSWSAMFGSFTKIQQQKGLTIRGPVTVDGVQAWVIANTQNSATADVAAQGTPYLLRLVAPGSGGSFDFTDWNTATIPPPPPASDVISMSQLSQYG